MDLTPEQHRAIYTHDKNLIVVAGAGSGKTRVLVERYLALLDAHTDWPLNALVAITFTRKAAQEMRDRVRRALEDRLSRAKADEQRIWSDRLASMESARIDTIHGLCATILRANAAEAGLDPDFGVMDEVEAGILLDTVIDDELGRLVDEHDPALALFAEYDRRGIIEALRQSMQTSLPGLPVDFMTEWQAHWQTWAAGCVERMRQSELLTAFVNWRPPYGWPDGDRLADVWLACIPDVEALLNPDTDVMTCLDILVRLETTIRLTGGSPKKWGGQEVFEAVKEYLRALRAVAQMTNRDIGQPPGELDARAAELLPLWCRLIGRVQGAYDAAKQREGALDFDDLERRTRDLLVSSAAVRQRYRLMEFRHVLVDEFQDTNAAQWDIVQALADPQQAGSLFVVGDQKQSIYAFRGADVSVFGGVRQQLTAFGGADAEIALARSFRTHQPLVGGFNAIFGHILTRNPASPVYAYEIDLGQPMDAHRQEPPADYPPVEFLLIDAEHAEEGRRAEAYAIARRLHDMVADATPVFDRATNHVRPVRYDDMALLFQSMSQITLYEEVFKALELPFVTVAGRGYYSRQEVWDLLNLLKTLYNPADNLALASVLRSPLFGLSDDALLALRLLEDEAGKRALLWDALSRPETVPADEVELVAFARECLYDLAALAGRVTISELLREALNRTGFLATLTGLPDGARRRGNVEKLLAKAESSGKITLGAFEQYLSDLSAREVREGEALVDVEGAVTLMTVHASKGLEYPVVVLVDAGWERGNRSADALLYDRDYGLCCKVYSAESEKLEPTVMFQQAQYRQRLREEAERRRLLYVAATRAQDYLLVSGCGKRSRDGVLKLDGWLDWLADALQLHEHLDLPGEKTLSYDWGQVRLNLRDSIVPDDLAAADEFPAWDRLPLDAPLPAEPVQPPLLRPVEVDRTAVARHLSVTQVADLGGSEVEPYYGQRFRRAVLQDAPGHVSPVPYPKSFKRLIGEMVHEALRWWQWDEEGRNLDQLLEAYAWEQGIVGEDEKRRAVREARALLEHYQRSEVYGWLTGAKALYRELPFVYDNGRRIIHGVIDTLFQRADGTWAVLDYKTSALERPDLRAAEAHARRFHMQVGVYAAAACEQLNVDAAQVAVYIHYVRFGLTVTVPAEHWQDALRKMEPYIGRLVGTEGL